jgi:SAM-dependent methyltransferase
MKASNIQTFTSFRNKWEQNPNLAFSETLREGSDIFNWILNRNGFHSVAQFRQWLAPRSRILDAGCGNGRVTALLHKYASDTAEVVGIDLTSAHVCSDNVCGLERVCIHEKDLMGDLSDLGGAFDLIYCQEVLHHTSDPKAAFLNLCTLLSQEGEIAIYVYKLKAPLREYADDYVRERISDLPYDEALKCMQEITWLGKVLNEINVKVTVPDVEMLGIEAGEYDIQRLIYHFFMKCFWNPSLTFEENAAINYDWYHPQLCSRHTIEEVRDWFVEAQLDIVHENVDFYGITIRGKLKAETQ